MPDFPAPRGRRTTAALLCGLVLAVAPTTAALADPGRPGPHPSAPAAELHQRTAQLKAARQQAAAEQRRLDRVRQAVTDAEQQVSAATATARVAIAHYADTMKQAERARRRSAAAQAVAVTAAAVAARQEARVAGFARASYMAGGPITSLATVLSSGSPTQLLDRAALLGSVSESQGAVLRRLDASRSRAVAAAAAAATAAHRLARVAHRADTDRRAALVAMADQQAALADLSHQRRALTERVSHDNSTVARLARERAAAELQVSIAQQQAALTAAWAQLQAVADTMPRATARQGRRVVAIARRQIGVPYSWGGGDRRGPTLGMVNQQGNAAGLRTVGFDCSGLTLFAWGRVGFTLDHYTGSQWVEGRHIALDHLRAGDLVFFATDTADPTTIHHVGIYAGGGRMIDAPHTGAAVRYDEVFDPGLIGAVRP